MSADRKPLHPLSAAGMILAACGGVAWAWTGEWRWGVTGLAAFLVLAVVGTVLDGRKQRSISDDRVAVQLSPGRSATVQGDTVSCTACSWTFTDVSAARRTHEWSLHTCPQEER